MLGDVDLEGVIIGAADFEGGKTEFLREIPGGDAVVEARGPGDVEGLAVRRGIAEHEPEGLHDVVDVDDVTAQGDTLGVCQDRDPLLPRLDEGEDVVGDLAKAVTGSAGFTLRSREKCLRRSSPSKTHEERSTVTGTPYCTNTAAPSSPPSPWRRRSIRIGRERMILVDGDGLGIKPDPVGRVSAEEEELFDALFPAGLESWKVPFTLTSKKVSASPSSSRVARRGRRRAPFPRPPWDR